MQLKTLEMTIYLNTYGYWGSLGESRLLGRSKETLWRIDNFPYSLRAI
jgi:hypothetical protein